MEAYSRVFRGVYFLFEIWIACYHLMHCLTPTSHYDIYILSLLYNHTNYLYLFLIRRVETTKPPYPTLQKRSTIHNRIQIHRIDKQIPLILILSLDFGLEMIYPSSVFQIISLSHLRRCSIPR